jgi:hypothetical protein
MRAFDTLTDFDCVRGHVLDTIDSSDRVAMGGWVFFDRFVLICRSEMTALPSMMRQAVGAMDVAGIEPKQMSTGLVRKSALLSRKMTSLVEAIELHEEPCLSPTWRTNYQMVRSRQPTGVLIPVVYLFGGEESKAKNSKVTYEYAEHREHDEFILVRASGE